MINVGEILLNLWNQSGFAQMFAGFGDGGWQNLVMLAISCVLLYLAIVKQFEPLLLCVLEAMKMENEIFAPKTGTVAQVLVQKGATVDTGATMVVIA